MRPSPPWLSREDDLGREQRFGEALIAPLLLAGAVGEHGQRPGGRRRLQRPEQVRQLGRRPAHAGISCVIARQRPDLDLDLVALAAPGALALELGLMRRVGDRQAAGEAAAVPAGELAGVQDDRGHLALGDAHLDAAPGERAGRSSSRCDRPARTAAAATRTTIRRSLSGSTPRQRPHPPALLDQPLGRDGADRAMHPLG